MARSMIQDLLAQANARFGADGFIVAFPSAPNNVSAASLDALIGIIFPTKESIPAAMEPTRVGWIHQPPYDWTLPRRKRPTLLFCGPRRHITAPMLRSALRGGITQILYAGRDGLQQEWIAAMLARRVYERLLHRIVRRLPGKESLLGRTLELHVAAALPRVSTTPAPRPYPSRIIFANYSLGLGGAERQIVNTLVGLRSRGYTDLALVCERRQDDSAENIFFQALETQGVSVTELPGLPLAAQSARLLDQLPLGIRDDIGFWLVALQSRRPNVLHAWQDPTAVKAGLAAAMLGVPRIVLASRNQSPTRFPYWLPWMRPIYRALARHPNVILTNNSIAGAADYARWLDIPLDRIQVVYNALSHDALMPAPHQAVENFRARHGISKSAPVVGSVFRFHPEKNPRLWIATAAVISARRPDARFLLIGDGPLRASTVEAARRLGIQDRTIFAGEVADVETALACMQVFLLTSRDEGLPNVVMEAQAQGIPVVTTRAGGAPEAIDPGRSGFVVDAPDPVSLATIVLRLLDDRALASAASARARELAASRFGIDRLIDDTLRLYGFTS